MKHEALFIRIYVTMCIRIYYKKNIVYTHHHVMYNIHIILYKSAYNENNDIKHCSIVKFQLFGDTLLST